MKKLDQKGSFIILFLIVLPFLITTAMYFMSLSLTSFQVARFDQLHTEAQLAADAGADYSIEQLALNSSWTGTASDVTLYSGNIKTTFSSSVSGSSSDRTITVTGKTYWPATAASPNRTVKIAVDLYPVTTGNYSIVAGAGGLTMSNSAKVVGGNVFINGTINLSNSAQIGLSTNPVNVQVADQACPTSPVDSTYPRVCVPADNAPQPISISNPAHIYGSVTATNQTNGSGMSNTGLVAGGSVNPQSLPTYNRAAQEAAVTNNMTGAQASCSGNQSVTWPANTKITGNVTLSTKCTVDLKGNVWITGTLSMTNQAQINVDNSLGTTMPVVMIDGSGGASFANSTQITSNSNSTGAEVITFYSTAACNPECSSVTGSNLYNSRTITTISMAQSFQAPNTILYAYWSQLQMSNSGQIGAVIGQTINMSNTATVTFGSSTGGAATTTYVVKGYRKL